MYKSIIVQVDFVKRQHQSLQYNTVILCVYSAGISVVAHERSTDLVSVILWLRFFILSARRENSSHFCVCKFDSRPYRNETVTNTQ